MGTRSGGPAPTGEPTRLPAVRERLGSRWCSGGFVAEVAGELSPSDVDGLSPDGAAGVCLLNLVVGRSGGQRQEQFDHGFAARPPFHFAETGDVG